MNYYHSDNYIHPISSIELKLADRDTQFEVMKSWFFMRYEKPALRLPYRNEDGDYIWIWGHPNEPYEALEPEFEGVVDDDLIKTLAKDLNQYCTLWWYSVPAEERFTEYIFDYISEIPNPCQNFATTIKNIKQLLEIEDHISNFYGQMLYVQVLTALGTYLSDMFIKIIVTNSDYMACFIRLTPEFENVKVSLPEAFDCVERPEAKVYEYLTSVDWLNLDLVQKIYFRTFQLALPNYNDIFKAILFRHDIVHRNGETIEGRTITVTKEDVQDLLRLIVDFVQQLDKELRITSTNNTRAEYDPCLNI